MHPEAVRQASHLGIWTRTTIGNRFHQLVVVLAAGCTVRLCPYPGVQSYFFEPVGLFNGGAMLALTADLKVLTYFASGERSRHLC